jgi:hypothetical protein
VSRLTEQHVYFFNKLAFGLGRQHWVAAWLARWWPPRRREDDERR